MNLKSVAAAALTVTAMVTAASAHAETDEDMFLGLMAQEGVSRSTPEETLAFGWAACDALRDGGKRGTTMVMGEDTRTSAITMYLAVATICPELSSALDGVEPPAYIPQEPTAAPKQQAPKSSYYPNCAAARAAGAAPLHRGDPGYSSSLDRDGDGIACE